MRLAFGVVRPQQIKMTATDKRILTVTCKWDWPLGWWDHNKSKWPPQTKEYWLLLVKSQSSSGSYLLFNLNHDLIKITKKSIKYWYLKGLARASFGLKYSTFCAQITVICCVFCEASPSLRFVNHLKWTHIILFRQSRNKQNIISENAEKLCQIWFKVGLTSNKNLHLSILSHRIYHQSRLSGLIWGATDCASTHIAKG